MSLKLSRPKILDGGEFYLGDNLESLRSMPSRMVDLVYLDPPYNTGMSWGSENDVESWSDIWAWDDGPAHPLANVVQRRDWEDWNCYSYPVTQKMKQIVRDIEDEQDTAAPRESKPSAYSAFMIPRLVEIHRVLSINGSMLMHVNDIESDNLVRICNVLFGRKNFRSKIVWRSSGVKLHSKMFSRMHDEILFYTKSKTHATWNTPFMDFPDGKFSATRHEDEHGKYYLSHMSGVRRATERTYDLRWRGFDYGDIGRQWAIPSGPMIEHYPWLDVPEEYEEWRKSNQRDKCLDYLDSEGLIVLNSKGIPMFKRYDFGVRGIQLGSVLPESTYSPVVPKRIVDALGGVYYRTMKPPSLLRILIEATTDEGDFVLDPFGGSGMTAAVAHSLSRRWATMDLTTGVERIAPVIADALPQYWDDTQEKYGRNAMDPYGVKAGNTDRVMDIRVSVGQSDPPAGDDYYSFYHMVSENRNPLEREDIL